MYMLFMKLLMRPQLSPAPPSSTGTTGGRHKHPPRSTAVPGLPATPRQALRKSVLRATWIPAKQGFRSCQRHASRQSGCSDGVEPREVECIVVFN